MNKVFYNTTLKSNSEGIVDFFFDPKNCVLCEDELERQADQIKLVLKPANFHVDRNVPHYKQLHSPQIIKYIQPWISKGSSYIQVFPSGNNKLTCGDIHRLKIKLRTSNELTGTDLVHFQFQSRSKFINTGSFNLESDGELVSQTKTKVTLAHKEQISLKLIKPNEFGDTRCRIDENLKKSTNSSRLLIELWGYDPSLNQCRLFTLEPSDSFGSFFHSQKSCESECKLSSFLYNAAGNPVATVNPDLVSVYEYTFDMDFEVTSEMSPDLRVLVFFVDNIELIPDHVSLTVEKCLRNKVGIILQKSSTTVKQQTLIGIKSSPMSICALSAIDKSVSFMGERNAIKLDKVFRKLSAFDSDPDYRNDYETFGDESDSWDPYPYPHPIPMPMPMPIEILEPEIEVELTNTNKLRRKRRIWFPSYGGGNRPYDPTKAFRVNFFHMRREIFQIK